MTQASQPVRGRILPPKEIAAEELTRRKEKHQWKIEEHHLRLENI